MVEAVNRIKHRKGAIIAVVILIAALAAGGWWHFRSKKAAVPILKTVQVMRSNVLSSVAATGTVIPVNIVDINSKITGRIKDVYVEENQNIREGDILLTLDDTDLQAQLNQAQAKLAYDRASFVKTKAGSRAQEIAEAQHKLSNAQAQLQHAQANRSRQQRLLEMGAIAQQALDDAQRDYDTAQADYQWYQEQLSLMQEGARVEELEMAQAQVQQSQANLNIQQANLDNAIIRSPITGTVVGKPLPKGQGVSQGISTPVVIMQVADLTTMQVNALIDETDISKVQVGQEASFTVDAYPVRRFKGIVTKVSSQATTQQNVVYYTVTIVVDNKDVLLKPTMTARVTINCAQRFNVLVVPSSAVHDIRGEKSVQVVKGGSILSMKVTTGLSNEEVTEIIDGLQEGDTVTLGANRMKNKSGN